MKNARTRKQMYLGMMQPYFFPYIGYYQLISAVDRYILYDNLNYIKRGWINRNRILLTSNNLAWLTVPLRHVSQDTRIKDVIIDRSFGWQKKMLKTLTHNYGKAPYFDVVFPLLRTLIEFDTDKLSVLNKNAIIQVCHYLNIDTELIVNYDKYLPVEADISGVNPAIPNIKNRSKMMERVFEICRIEGANTYYNAIGGKTLYSKETFAGRGIELKFIKTRAYSYKQSTYHFVPDLSIIDVMMHNSVEDIKTLLLNYDLD